MPAGWADARLRHEESESRAVKSRSGSDRLSLAQLNECHGAVRHRHLAIFSCQLNRSKADFKLVTSCPLAGSNRRKIRQNFPWRLSVDPTEPSQIDNGLAFVIAVPRRVVCHSEDLDGVRVRHLQHLTSRARSVLDPAAESGLFNRAGACRASLLVHRRAGGEGQRRASKDDRQVPAQHPSRRRDVQGLHDRLRALRWNLHVPETAGRSSPVGHDSLAHERLGQGVRRQDPHAVVEQRRWCLRFVDHQPKQLSIVGRRHQNQRRHHAWNVFVTKHRQLGAQSRREARRWRRVDRREGEDDLQESQRIRRQRRAICEDDRGETRVDALRSFKQSQNNRKIFVISPESK